MPRVVVLLDGGYLSALLKQEGTASKDGRIIAFPLNYEDFCKSGGSG